MEEACCVLQVRYAAGPQPEPHHHHSGYQFLFIRRGRCRIRAGQEFLEATAGDLVIFSHLEMHDVQPLQQPYERYHMLLSPYKLPETLGDQRLLGILLNCASNGFRLTHLAEGAAFASSIFERLLHEYQGSAPMREEWLDCLVKQLLLLLYRCKRRDAPAEEGTPEPAASRLVWSVKEFLELHCTEPLVISRLAEQFYASASHLTHLFKRETGYNLKQYLQLCRLAEARRLLLESEDSVLEVSQKAGFSDINNFIRYFKRETGLTPGQYRRQRGLPSEKG